MLRFEELEPGEYYVPVFERFEALGEAIEQRYRTDSPHFKYLGSGEFATEDGQPIEYFYDPELGLNVALDAPDGFIQ